MYTNYNTHILFPAATEKLQWQNQNAIIIGSRDCSKLIFSWTRMITKNTLQRPSMALQRKMYFLT